MNARPAVGHTILRAIIGLIFFMHGMPKLVGGIPGTAQFLESVGIPAPMAMAWFVALLETVGGIALMVGLFVTPIAFLFIVHMITGIALVHIPNGFYVIGPGQGGYEFNLLLIAGLAALILGGPGLWAIDGRRKRTAP